jgi:hypothetical protein
MSSDRREARLAVEKLTEILRAQIAPKRNELISMDGYVKKAPEKMTFNEDGTFTGGQWRTEYVTRPSSILFHVKVMPEFEKTKDYQDTLTKLSDFFQQRKEFIQDILSSYLANAVSNGIKDDIEVLMDDLENKPPSWQVTARMYGITPESKEIKLSEGVKLRRVNEEDLIFEEPIFGLRVGRNLLSIPHSILEISLTTSNPNDVQKKVEKLTILLSLFRETCASYESYSMKTKSYTPYEGTISRNTFLSREPKVIIKNSERDYLSTFIQYFEPRIPDAVIFGEPLDPLEISIKRYLESIRENLPIEEKLTRAVMGLEALFLENETELRFRLSLRVAQLLGYLNEDSPAVYAVVSEAYDYRSSHVHGSVLSSDKKLKANEALKNIWRYLRKAILIWLIEDVSSEAKKRVFIKQIDGALIDDTQRQTFKMKIEADRSYLKSAI